MTNDQPLDSSPSLPPGSDELCRAIGQSVIVCQAFEYLFVVFAKVIVPLEMTPDRTDLLSPDVFKNATKQLLNELRARIDIDPGYEERLCQFIECRHVLVHRGIGEFGGSVEKYHEFSQLVAIEATIQTCLLLDYCRQGLAAYGEELDIPADLEKFVERLYDEIPSFSVAFRPRAKT